MAEKKDPKSSKTFILKKIEFEYQSYGVYKDQYLGKIKFENGEFEGFSFQLTPDMAAKYLSLMKDQIIESATTLPKDLINTLPMI